MGTPEYIILLFFLVILAIPAFVLYLIVRAGVHGGVRDAQRRATPGKTSYCISCGSARALHAKFCGSCGTRF